MNWAEIYHFRYFLRNLVARDLKVRYKGSFLGLLWSLLNPLLMMVVLSLVFSKALRINIHNYPVFLLCGLLPWNFFAISVSNATASIVSQAGLLKKVAFPRDILPLASILGNLIHFGIGLVILFVFLIIFKVKLGLPILGLPFVVLLQFIFVLGLALVLSSLNVFYRDVQQILEVLLLIWFYLTPVIYPLTMIPERFHRFYLLNPMASQVSIYRSLLFENRMPSLKIIIAAIILSLLTLLMGDLVFRRYRFRFSEEL
jgi:lipopolysaccharide transport system permease protein